MEKGALFYRKLHIVFKKQSNSSEKTTILVNAKIECPAVAAGSHRVEDYTIFSGFSGDFHYINALFKFLGCRFDSVRLFYAC